MARSAAIPQPRGLPLTGNLADLNPHTPVQSMMALARVHGPIFRIPRRQADAAGDFSGDFERWYAGFWPALAAVEAADAGQGPDEAALPCPYHSAV
jgi:hypothetical protein